MNITLKNTLKNFCFVGVYLQLKYWYCTVDYDCIVVFYYVECFDIRQVKLVQIGTKTEPAQEEIPSMVSRYAVLETGTVVLDTQETGTVVFGTQEAAIVVLGTQEPGTVVLGIPGYKGISFW